MSEKTRKQDRRTRYTRQTIKDTFLELLNQKSFTKITVTEICKNAEINRGTFYLHYYDIHDVLTDIFDDMIMVIMELRLKMSTLARRMQQINMRKTN